MNPYIQAFAQLGLYLQKELTSPSEVFSFMLKKAQEQNPWFVPEQVQYALATWTQCLDQQKLHSWLSPYSTAKEPKQVAIIMAGNIPLVGFHDFLSVIGTGHNALIRLSSADKILLPFLCEKLVQIAPSLEKKIAFTQEKITAFDAVIATGSNNTARYFEYYFKNKPSIIRKSRNSVAVLSGKETAEELSGLADDIFRYFGLGCRSVSKLFVPKGYDFKDFFQAVYPYGRLLEHPKYANNYDYNKAVYLMSLFPIIENGFLLLREEKSYASPIASVFYEYYTDQAQLTQRLQNDAQQIQCVVGHGFLPFGTTQCPSLTDYADGVNTLEFLTSL